MKKKRKYLSHEKLGITFQQFAGLLSVRTMLEMGVLIYHPMNTGVGSAKWKMSSGHFFNMNEWLGKNSHCGSIGCIGGTLTQILGVEETSSSIDTMNGLFYPNHDVDVRKKNFNDSYKSYSAITPKQAIKAIDNFLTFGKPKWMTILGTPKAYNKRHRIW